VLEENSLFACYQPIAEYIRDVSFLLVGSNVECRQSPDSSSGSRGLYGLGWFSIDLVGGALLIGPSDLFVKVGYLQIDD
jgi:hypothetical protein